MNSSSTLRRPEILAPVGTEEAFVAALASGADAVYLGLAEGFNARGRSTAFELEALPELVRRAHRACVKLYLTLNTLVFERELEPVEKLLRAVLRAGVDALIIQDPAIAFVARRLLPGVRLHASTQMTISSAEGVAFAASLGIQRVVLPRELNAREIALVARDCSLECEVFVHGALCMAWSGQCLTSEAFSGRSANRGQCSQACRMPYQAIVDGEPKELGDLRYLLSPQDLAAHDALPALLEAGVCSLKIEGRYKGPAYVMTAVDSWRHWRDALLRGDIEGGRTQLAQDVQKTQLVFSRGGSTGFLDGDDHQTLVEGTTPKHRGIALGTVVQVKQRSVVVEAEAEHDASGVIRSGVGVKFELVGRVGGEYDPERAPGGPVFGVQRLRRGRLELLFGRPGPELSLVRAGDRVRVTGDSELVRDMERRALQTQAGRWPLVLRVHGGEGRTLRVFGTASWGQRIVNATAEGHTPLALAQGGRGLDARLLRDKLGALGGTSFYLLELELEGLPNGLHLPVSELKHLRRVLVDELQVQLERPVAVLPSREPSLPALRSELARDGSPLTSSPAVVPLCRTTEQLEAVIASGLGEGAEVELDWMEMVGLGRAVARAREVGLRVTLVTVRVQKPGEEAYDRRIAKLEPDGVLVRHWGALMHFSKHLKEGAGLERDAFSLHGDFSLNVTNSLTALHLLGLGLDTVTASHDLDAEQLLDLLSAVPPGRVAVTLHHHIATFHNSHCTYAHLLSQGSDYQSCGRPCEQHRLALRDYAGHEHPVVVDVACRNTVFNAFAQSAAPLVPRLLERGVRRFRVEFVWERADEVQRTLAAYKQLIGGQVTPAAALKAAAAHERYGVVTPLRLRRER